MFSLLTPILKKCSEQFLIALLRYDLQTLRNHLEGPFCVTQSLCFRVFHKARYPEVKQLRQRVSICLSSRNTSPNAPPVLIDTPNQQIIRVLILFYPGQHER